MKTKSKSRSKSLNRIPKGNVTALRSLAKTINQAHRETVSKGQELLEAAKRCGKALIEAKELLPNGHGSWLPWLAKNCSDVSEDTAQRYMRIARDGVENAKTIRQAYLATGIIVAPPKPTPAHESKQLSTGNGSLADHYSASIGLGKPKPDTKPEAAPAKPEPEPAAKKEPASAASKKEPKQKPVADLVPIKKDDLGLMRKLNGLVSGVMDEVTVLERLDVDRELIRRTLGPVIQWTQCRGGE